MGKASEPPCMPTNSTPDLVFVRVSVFGMSRLLAPHNPKPYSWFAIRYVHRFYLMLPPDRASRLRALALLVWLFRTNAVSFKLFLFGNTTLVLQKQSCAMPRTRWYGSMDGALSL